MHPELALWPQWGCAGQDEDFCQHWGAQAAMGQGLVSQPCWYTAKPPFPLGSPARASTYK